MSNSIDSAWRRLARGRLGVLIGAGAVVVVALTIVVNAVHGTTQAAAATRGASGTPAMKGMKGMKGMTGTMPAKGSDAVLTVRGGALPAMAASGAMPMAMTPLGQAEWDGMKIAARATAPATFLLFNGSTQQPVYPTKKDSFHLMVTLSDAESGFAIPYSSVWATLTKAGKVVYDERLWPMISRYMGPHYGNNVSLPTGGVYHLTLLVSPPEAARHVEYKNLWLKPHRVSLTFNWVPKA